MVDTFNLDWGYLFWIFISYNSGDVYERNLNFIGKNRTKYWYITVSLKLFFHCFCHLKSKSHYHINHKKNRSYFHVFKNVQYDSPLELNRVHNDSLSHSSKQLYQETWNGIIENVLKQIGISKHPSIENRWIVSELWIVITQAYSNINIFSKKYIYIFSVTQLKLTQWYSVQEEKLKKNWNSWNELKRPIVSNH